MARQNGEEPKPKLTSIVFPALFLIVWLAICFSALLRNAFRPDGVDWLAFALILGLGGFGASGLLRGVIRAIKRYSGDI